MASSMIEIMAQQLGQDAMAGMIASQVGIDKRTAQQAVKIGLPLIVSALARNAGDKQGADALSGALERDHDGSLWDNVGGYFEGGGDVSQGDAILGHVLGGDRSRIQAELGRETGLDPSVLAKLLPLLAPLVLAYLGRAQRQKGFKPDDLSGYLNKERSYIEQRAEMPRINPPQQGRQQASTSGDLLSSILDSNKDGSVADDAARIGVGILGKLFRGKR